jgi:hypothetical protein
MLGMRQQMHRRQNGKWAAEELKLPVPQLIRIDRRSWASDRSR